MARAGESPRVIPAWQVLEDRVELMHDEQTRVGAPAIGAIEPQRGIGEQAELGRRGFVAVAIILESRREARAEARRAVTLLDLAKILVDFAARGG